MLSTTGHTGNKCTRRYAVYAAEWLKLRQDRATRLLRLELWTHTMVGVTTLENCLGSTCQ